MHACSAPGKAVAPVPDPREAQESSGNRWPLQAPATSLPPKAPAFVAVPRQLPEGITLQASALPAFWIWLNSDRLPSKTQDFPVPRIISFRIGSPPGNAGPTHSTEPETASNDRGTQIRPTGLHVPLPTNEPSTAHDIPCSGLRPGSLDNRGLPVRCEGEIHSRQQLPADIECCDPFR